MLQVPPNDKLTDEVQGDGVIKMSCLRTYTSITLEMKENVPIRELYEIIRNHSVKSDICHGLSWVSLVENYQHLIKWHANFI